jgi:putative membrane protein
MEKIKNILKSRVFYYYFFLITGGIWHITNLIPEIMNFLSAFMIMAISLISIIIYSKNKLNNYLILLLIFIVSFLAEYIGVKTGILFGEYNYSDVLLLQINNVPIAIGFAWISTLLTSFAISQKLNANKYILSIINAGLMTGLDFFLEPAAIKLNYWQWDTVSVPLFNYFTWFILSFIFSFISLKYIDRKEKINELAHLYIAQIIYFILIWLFF